MTTGKIGVTVSVDLDASSVTIRPVGVLTRHNVRALQAVCARAQRALPQCDLFLDDSFLAYAWDEAPDLLKDIGIRTSTMSGPRHASRTAGRRTQAQAA